MASTVFRRAVTTMFLLILCLLLPAVYSYDRRFAMSDESRMDIQKRILETYLRHLFNRPNTEGESRDNLHISIHPYGKERGLPVHSESWYPFRRAYIDRSDAVKSTVNAFRVLMNNINERGCSPADIIEAFNKVPNLKDLLKKLIIPKHVCPFHGTHYSCAPGSRFRSSDGSCNNLNYPWFGKSRIPFIRFLAPKYDDYIGSARTNSTLPGHFLPDPMLIAHNLMFDRRHYDFRLTNLLPLFGLFVFNDIYAISIHSNPIKQTIDCDELNSNDNIILRYSNGQCIAFPRSTATFASSECNFTPREQINSATSWLDLSQVYGNNEDDTERIRAFRNGLLKTTTFAEMVYPQTLVKDLNLCIEGSPNGMCFDSGDKRINENMGIVGIYTLFIREHNKIADQLRRMNPLWRDEELFEEARRINIAQYQHIVAREFLPILLGPDVTFHNDLLPLRQGYYTSYNKNADPGTRNEIASALGPSILTMFRGKLSSYSPHMVKIDEINLRDSDFNVSFAFNASTEGINGFIRGMLVDYAGRFDRHFTDALHGSIPTKSTPAAAVLIGRDHGLSSYNDYRVYCGLARLKNFYDLKDVMDLETIALLSYLYRNVDDIDFFSGAVSELPLTNALVGPTMSCLLANQFKLLKKSDRFYYESNDPVVRFSNDQLSEIRKASLARIICDNVDNLPFIQPNALISSLIDGNARRSCSLLARRKMEAWYDLRQNEFNKEMEGPKIRNVANGFNFVAPFY